MTADTAPEPSTEQPGPNSATGAARHLHPVPTNEPVQDSPAAQSTENENNTVEDTDEQPAEVDPTDPTGSSRVDLTALLAWGRATFTPDSGLWTTRPLAPDEVLDRARRGSQLADAGPLRTASAAHGRVSAAAKITLRTIEWVFFDHIARFAVALVVLTALCVYPPTATVLGYALTPLVWAHDLLI